MARISGVDLPREKRVEIGLTYIFGIGLKTSQDILAGTGVNPDTRVKDLTEKDVNKTIYLGRVRRNAYHHTCTQLRCILEVIPHKQFTLANRVTARQRIDGLSRLHKMLTNTHAIAALAVACCTLALNLAR